MDLDEAELGGVVTWMEPKDSSLVQVYRGPDGVAWRAWARWARDAKNGASTSTNGDKSWDSNGIWGFLPSGKLRVCELEHGH